MSLNISDDVVDLPLVCELCKELELLNGKESEIFNVGKTGDDVGEGNWYLHLFESPLEIDDDGTITDARLVALCPDCAPESLLSDSELDAYLDSN